jgi:hypothetical protein
MCGYIVDLPRLYPGVREGESHCPASGGACLIDLAKMRAFCGASAPGYVGVHRGTACASVLFFFDNDHRSAFSDNEAITEAIEWPAGLVGRTLPF